MAQARRRLPGGVIALGLVSLCMDASSELVHSLLPVFMSSVLGASLLSIGIIEGIAEATAAITKVFSGVLSDRWQRRKGLVVLGYGLAALTKPIFPLAESLAAVLGARFLDRIGKGIRGAPRDALVADITPPALRNAAYGLRQSMDSVGAFIGPLLAVGLMLLWQDDIRAVLWVAVVPAVLAVVLLMAGVQEPDRAALTEKAHGRPGRSPLTPGELRRLGTRYWLIVLFGGVLTLARFSEAFLVLRAQDLGVTLAWIPAVLVVMNVVYAASSYPAGLAASRWSRRTLLGIGVAMLLVADLVLALATSPGLVFLGTALWGLHMGLTQGLIAALIADTIPADQRGTAFGFFNLITGILMLVASVVAGGLWDGFGAAATFLAGAVFSALALCGYLACARMFRSANKSGSH